MKSDQATPLAKLRTKMEALHSLHRLGLPAPPSIFVTDKKDLAATEEHLRDYDDSTEWVLRGSSRSVRPEILTSLELIERIRDLAQPALLATRRVEETVSGLFFRGPSFTYVESVSGALSQLTRDGQTPYRHLLRDSTVVPFAKSSEDSTARESPNSSSEELQSSAADYLSKYIMLIPPPALLEWMLTSTGAVSFVDYKMPRRDFLGDIGFLQEGLSRDCAFSLARPLFGPTSPAPLPGHILVADRPTLDYYFFDALPSGALFKTGGLLSHLVTRWAEQGIPVVISAHSYGKATREQGIDLHPG